MSDSIFSFIHFIATSGISITFFLIFLLLKKKDNQQVNLLLASILFCFLCLFLAYATLTAEVTTLSIPVMAFALTTPFALGPLLNFYVDNIYRQQKPVRRSFLLHLLPFFLSILLFSVPITTINWMNDQVTLENFPSYAIFIPVLGILSVIGYLRLLYQKLKRYRSEVKDNYASLETKDLAWLQLWLRGIMIFILLDITLSLLSIMAEELNQLIFLNITYLFGLVVYIGYSGIQQTPVFISVSGPITSETKKKITTPYQPGAAKSPLEQQLINLFEEEKIYLNDSLSLNDVASALEASPKKITELLNAEMNTNFYALVNQFRVEDFKRKLASSEVHHKTFLGLAYESGFKSKATFNRAFKEITGMTPKAYQSELR
ncbi:MAG: AraC family transcriptional regulator [Cytophagales bacterium]|nr:AraC family transcriptional regulator [Cytophagales bacterium]